MMSKEVRLRGVTADNWEDVVDLEVLDRQRDFVASNAYSLAESKFDPTARPRAVYAGRRVVGFLMYDSLASEGRPHDYSIYRFMIDKDQQGKGYGRSAIARAIDEIKQDDPQADRITVCYMPDNPVSKLYRGLGFKEIGLDEDGEMVAELMIAKEDAG
jgi:diamine N-acetyltransferase